jgi:hypothetical protein
MFAFVFVKNKLTMIAGPLPFNALVQLAETKVRSNLSSFCDLLVRQSNWQGGTGESPNIQRFSKPE